jgi:hypothetical protein
MEQHFSLPREMFSRVNAMETFDGKEIDTGPLSCHLEDSRWPMESNRRDFSGSISSPRLAGNDKLEATKSRHVQIGWSICRTTNDDKSSSLRPVRSSSWEMQIERQVIRVRVMGTHFPDHVSVGHVEEKMFHWLKMISVETIEMKIMMELIVSQNGGEKTFVRQTFWRIESSEQLCLWPHGQDDLMSHGTDIDSTFSSKVTFDEQTLSHFTSTNEKNSRMMPEQMV